MIGSWKYYRVKLWFSSLYVQYRYDLKSECEDVFPAFLEFFKLLVTIMLRITLLPINIILYITFGGLIKHHKEKEDE